MKGPLRLTWAIAIAFFTGCFHQDPVSSNRIDTVYVNQHDTFFFTTDTLFSYDTLLNPDTVTLYIPRPVSFSKDLQPLFTLSCMPCHSKAGGRAALGFNSTGGFKVDTLTGDTLKIAVELGPADSYQTLLAQVYVRPGVLADTLFPIDRVIPGDTANSFLWWKLTRSDSTLESMGKGLKMPLGNEPLGTRQLEMISTWIMEGATNN